MTTVAPGKPGIDPTWTSSAKEGVGSARTAASPLWYTLSHGILNEVYYPRIDHACTRDLEWLVVTPDGRFFEEKRHGRNQVATAAPCTPAFDVRVVDPEGAFEIRKRVVADPLRPTLLEEVALLPASGAPADFEMVLLLAPHLANRGGDNTAWVGDYKGRSVVFAAAREAALAVAISAPVARMSVGYVGFSDAWQDLDRNGHMTWAWERAEDGNVAIGVSPDLAACGGRFTVAVGFGGTPAEAGQRAVASLVEGFDRCWDRFAAEWAEWREGIRVPGEADPVAAASAIVLATHEARSFPGGLVASLSVPWGFAKGDDDLGGYHLVWPRDHCEAAGGLLALEDHEAARRAVDFLISTQEADGHWAQNMWLDGTPHWSGIQMDETALPILLLDLAGRRGTMADDAGGYGWEMIRRAAAFLLRSGPVTGQDRWEEEGGYSPFTLAAEIAALVTAAEHAERAGEPESARYLRETASCWDSQIERWCYVSDTELARDVGVEGYYVRIAPSDECEHASALDGWIPIKNRPPGEGTRPARDVVSPDALALVRFGVRSFDDPRITNTLRVIDARLRVDLPCGPGWYRYSGDGYGEHEDGSPFDGTGIGRVWPLLTGERAHYAVAAGRLDEARRLAATMRAMAGNGGLLPEQTWDAPDIPERELFLGRPAGSAMPLAWAHAEYIKLLRSIEDGAVFDFPAAMRRWSPDPVRRLCWKPNHKLRSIRHGCALRVELGVPGTVRWSTERGLWSEAATHDSGLGIHYVDIPTGSWEVGDRITLMPEGPDGDAHDLTVEAERISTRGR